RSDAAEHLVVVRRCQYRTHPPHDAPVEGGDRTEDGGVQPVDAVGQCRRPDGELVQSLDPGVVDVRQHAAPGGRRIGGPQHREFLERALTPLGDDSGQRVAGHEGSLHRGCARPSARISTRLAPASSAGTRENPSTIAHCAAPGWSATPPERNPPSARRDRTTTGPSAIDPVSDAVHSPLIAALARRPPCPRPLPVASGSIDLGRACMPAYAIPASATGTWPHPPGQTPAATSISEARVNSTVAAVSAGTLPCACARRAHSGMTSRAGPIRATNNPVSAASSPST